MSSTKNNYNFGRTTCELASTRTPVLLHLLPLGLSCPLVLDPLFQNTPTKNQIKPSEIKKVNKSLVVGWTVITTSWANHIEHQPCKEAHVTPPTSLYVTLPFYMCLGSKMRSNNKGNRLLYSCIVTTQVLGRQNFGCCF